MATQSVFIGEVPNDEDCIGIGEPGYSANHSKQEATIYMRQLIRKFGDPPFGAQYKVVVQRHDAGTYYIVECHYNDFLPAAEEYAFSVELGCDRWDAIAKEELASLKQSN